MKKTNITFQLLFLALIGISCSQKRTKKVIPLAETAKVSNPILVESSDYVDNENKTFIKGKVHNWLSDTIYLTTLNYYSPYSNETYYQTLSKDSTFHFNFDEIDQPIIIQLSATKSSIDQNINALLFDNLTDKHYFGQCAKFNTFKVSTYLLEPNDSILVEINFNSWVEKLSNKKAKRLRSMGIEVEKDNTIRDYGKTGLTFGNKDKKSLEYYQKWFAVDDKFDSQIELSKNPENAFKKVVLLQEKLLADLHEEESNITPFLYKYLKTSIEFSAKKEFLKDLILKNKEYLKGDVSNEILDFLKFDKQNIDYSTLLCDQFNDYLEFYLTYKINDEKKRTNTYYEFSSEKFDFVLKELPEKSQYSYLANQLLHQQNSIENKNLYNRFLKSFPKGNLNKKLKEKFQ